MIGTSAPVLQRVKRWWDKPGAEKVSVVRHRLKWAVNKLGLPFPVRLPGGGIWLAYGDQCGEWIFAGSFEPSETRFVRRFVREGMNVLDIGAHQGYYTVIAAKRVRPAGRLIAFEPSPRERARLERNVRLNHLSNVLVEPFAVAASEGTRTLHMVQGVATGLNSLAPPAISAPTIPVEVKTVTLDGYLRERKIDRIDFIKMDAEGAEMEILQGAKDLLERKPRPVILSEMDDLRTKPWGYTARDFIAKIEAADYRCLGLDEEGKLVPRQTRNSYNLVLVPFESLGAYSEHVSG